jgi:hypothetical protein
VVGWDSDACIGVAVDQKTKKRAGALNITEVTTDELTDDRQPALLRENTWVRVRKLLC